MRFHLCPTLALAGRKDRSKSFHRPTLPMISSGGTSLLVTMVVFGLLANFARHEPQAVSALRSEITCSRREGVVSRLLRLRPPVPYAPVPRRRRIPHPVRTGGGRR